MRKAILAIMLLVNVSAFAIEKKTKLVVGITVSNFYPEWLMIYKNDLSERGLKRLVSQGKRCIADYNYMYSQTGMDHSTIYSGMLPAEHGIVAHEWYDRLRNKRQSNIADQEYMLIGDAGQGVSPQKLEALTLGSAMKMNSAFSKVYSIAANGEEAVLSGGSAADMALWFSTYNGKWISSSYYADSLPHWLCVYNKNIESDFFIRRGWMSLADENANNTALKLKSKVGLANNFFYDLMQAKRKYNTYQILKATPYMNTLIVDLATELVKNENLGRDNDADLLALNFSCLDYMNRDYEVYSREFQDVVMRLDKDIERLFGELDAKVGEGNYTVFLTFSEARELLPRDLQKMRLTSEYFSIFKAVALMKSFLSSMYGPGDWILDYDASQIYLDRALIEKNKISLKDMQDKIADFLVEFEGVSHVMTSHALTHNAATAGSGVLFQNAFSQKRSGDILYSLQPTWVADLKDREDYYAYYSKRHRVPLYLYGAGVPAGIPEKCQMTELLSIMCQILKIPVPYTADR